MKKTLLITGVLLALTASLASAAGVSLNWDDCANHPGLSVNKNFACNTNVGNFDLSISVDPPSGVDATNGHNHFVDLQAGLENAPLPAWWDHRNTGSCRQSNGLVASADFSVFSSGGFACPDPWGGGATGAIAGYNKNFNGIANRVRIVGSVSNPAPVAMPPGQEYYSMRIRINATRTVGTGACAGCQEPACLVLNLVRIAQVPGTPAGDVAVTNPIDQKLNYVTWQGGVVGGPGCPGVTPTQNTTWGKIKSIYR